jgi:hypothetical protein
MKNDSAQWTGKGRGNDEDDRDLVNRVWGRSGECSSSTVLNSAFVMCLMTRTSALWLHSLHTDEHWEDTNDPLAQWSMPRIGLTVNFRAAAAVHVQVREGHNGRGLHEAAARHTWE